MHKEDFLQPQGMTLLASFAIFFIIAAIAFGAFFILDYYQAQPVTNTNSSTGVVSTQGTIAQRLAAQSQLKKFNNTDELVSFLDENTATNSYGYKSNSLLIEDVAQSAPSVDASLGLGSADPEETSRDYSQTNIQVEGVDEGDIVKTDGDYIYTISANDVVIIDIADLSSPKEVSRLTYTSAPEGLYVYQDTLIVYGTDYEIRKLSESMIRPSSTYTFVAVYDISDRTDPTEERKVDIEGYFTTSRMIDDVVYLVTTQSTVYYNEEYPLPILLDDGVMLPLSGTRCNCPDMYYIDAPYPSQVFTSLTALSVTDMDAELGQELFVLESAENVYVSEDNLYLAYTKYIDEYEITTQAQEDVLIPLLSESDQKKIKEIGQSPSYILTNYEKNQKILTFLYQYLNGLDDEAQASLETKVESAIEAAYQDIASELEKTVIHKISLDGLSMRRAASGEVVGHVLNQFSMDEQDGNLRVATTKNQRWSSFDIFSSESFNNVYVLDEDLDVIGQVENLAKGERIYSVRFMQDMAYLVTFRQIDPLFVIGLSDSEHPEVLGELKVPGFSSYLHPYDNETLIGVGKQADANGRVTGLKLSLFDVSDANNLKEIDTYEFEGSWNDSIALTDHKAFLFSLPLNLLVLPVTTYTTQDSGAVTSTVQTNGAAVFTVTREGFTYRDRIDHSDGSSSDNNSRSFYDYSYYDTAVKRALYVEDALFTVSTKYLQEHSIDTLTQGASISLQ